MHEIEFAFAVILYMMVVPYAIDPPTPYEHMKERILNVLITRAKRKRK